MLLILLLSILSYGMIEHFFHKQSLTQEENQWLVVIIYISQALPMYRKRY
jgi:hypothetical protein